ncbi:MAG: hypothetical protein JOS17DRAFT_768509 [Linnemannia elongata]|nr:MAG: hypothetical protein JOS17DRAFT_768509 [Linnemannia elongata]
MMSAESQSQLRTHDQIDKRVPPEIWERIFNRLYPSQLTRVSMVNHNFNKIVSSLSVWPRMFSMVFGPTRRLRTLRNMPESKSYMLYMCASSLHVCEECLGMTPFSSNLTTSTKPVPVLAVLPTMTKGDIIYQGEEFNEDWKIWLCQSCRNKHISSGELVGDGKTWERIKWYRKQD